MYYYLIYSSKAVPGITEKHLQDIIRQAETKNDLKGITGMLVYHDRTFIQMLEGNEQAVRETFDRITEDYRHTAVIELFSGYENKRHFADWNMALEVVDDATFSKIGAYRTLEDGDRLLHQVDDGHIGLKMLRYFYEMRN